MSRRLRFVLVVATVAGGCARKAPVPRVAAEHAPIAAMEAAPEAAAAPAGLSCGNGRPLVVHVYNVAQALAVMVDLPGGQHILYDTGDVATRQGCGQPCQDANDHLLSQLATDLHGDPIAMMWISHQHSDHIGGAPS